MNSNLIKLEFNKILDILEDYCKTYIGKNICSNILPSNNINEVKSLLQETSEAYDLIIREGSLPIDEIEDITPYIKNLESYIPLTAGALLQIAKILKVSADLRSYYNNSETADKTTNEQIANSSLINKFEALYTNPGIYQEITKAILDENNIADDASKTLNSLRRNRRRLESGIKEKLNSFIHSSSYSKYIMEPIITIRNDRYVIPVKIEYKENINGLIHDWFNT